MKKQWARELAIGQAIDDLFAISSREIRTSRNGDAYVVLEMTDRSGRIRGVLFKPSASEIAVPVGAVVRAQGVVTRYRGQSRVSLKHIAPEDSYHAGDLMLAGEQDPSELKRRMKALITSVSDRRLRSVLSAVFGDQGFRVRFEQCPGAQSYHHAYLGGLLEHTVSVAAICASAAALYPDVDRDLLVSAALLHDVGKVDEYSWSTTIEYSDAGRLLGHVVLGEQRVRECVLSRVPDFPQQLLLRLSHAILSHHGELEWGAPKRPSTLEALLLHHADNMDAKVTGFSALLGAATAADERWTDAQNLFKRPLFAPASAEAARRVPSSEDDQYVSISA